MFLLNLIGAHLSGLTAEGLRLTRADSSSLILIFPSARPRCCFIEMQLRVRGRPAFRRALRFRAAPIRWAEKREKKGIDPGAGHSRGWVTGSEGDVCTSRLRKTAKYTCRASSASRTLDELCKFQKFYDI